MGKTVVLQKVEYSRNRQEASFKRVMDESIEKFTQLWETYKDHEYYDEIMIWKLMGLRVYVAGLALKFKNSAFETERNGG